jgi:hypothetical protein
MKKSILIFIAFLFAFSIFAQSPHMFNYQAVVRSSTGDILANQNVSFEIVILQTSPTGTPVYTETHNTATNEYGLVTLKIGDGATLDDLSAIDWGANDYYLKVSLDEEGGTNYQEMGITQILSVPYSLYSETAENVADNSITSEKILDGGVQSADMEDGAALAEILDDDGSGSGLDADLLDGESSGYYRNASNINTGTLNNAHFSSYQDLISEEKFIEITGTTLASGTYTDYDLPAGWTMNNTRVISAEIFRNSHYWSGLGYSYVESEVGIRYFLWNNGVKDFLRVMYPDNDDFRGESIRILLFKIG